MSGVGALVDVAAVDPVNVTVVRVVDVVAMREGHVSTALTVRVRVVLVRAVLGGSARWGSLRVPGSWPPSAGAVRKG
jgi:hypothetical protein